MKHAFFLLLAMFLFCTAPYSVRAESDEALYHQAVQLLTNKDYANA